MTEFHSVKAFAREEPRIELIEATLRSLLSLVELEFEGEPVQVDGFRLRNLEDWRTAPGTSLQFSLGSLSTACNCRCMFCYEEGNPPGLFETEPRFVGLEEARMRGKYLRDGRGLPLESKSSFEALTNPHFLDLVRPLGPGPPPLNGSVEMQRERTSDILVLAEREEADAVMRAPDVVVAYARKRAWRGGPVLSLAQLWLANYDADFSGNPVSWHDGWS